MEVLYKHDERVHNFSAAREILPFLIKMFAPSSILDVGCGIGTWLSVAKELQVKEVLGIDGTYVDRDLLKVDSTEFLEYDLRSPLNLQKKFDLALCLEVAEHLPDSSSGVLVQSLCKHSDVIVFSAAIPGQGGQNHLNEQWPSYWVQLFEKEGFLCYDILRPVFWNNEQVEFWYKQNMLLFSKVDIASGISEWPKPSKINIVHPELFEKVSSIASSLDNENQLLRARINKPGVRFAFELFLNSIRQKLN